MRLTIQTTLFKIITTTLVKSGDLYVPSILIQKKEGQETVQV